MTPEELARLFHETYERLAPEHGYRTREASAVPWEDVPENNRALMIATAGAVLESMPRYTRVSDDDGHSYVCPVDQADEFDRRVVAGLAHWGQFDPEGPAPPSPEDLPGLVRWEGARITFTDPSVQAVAPSRVGSDVMRASAEVERLEALLNRWEAAIFGAPADMPRDFERMVRRSADELIRERGEAPRPTESISVTTDG